MSKKALKALKRNRPNKKESLDPAVKHKHGVMSPQNPPLSASGKPLRLIGASLGATIKVGDNYMRFDAWEAKLVEDDPRVVEKEKRKLAQRLREEIVTQHQEAEEELVED